MRHIVTNSKLRSDIKGLYQEWQRHNVKPICLLLNLYLIGSTASLLLFDLLIFGDSAGIYRPGRVALLILSISCTAALPYLGVALTSIFLSLVPIAWGIAYVHFLMATPQEFFAIVMGGNYFAMFALSLLIHRFYKANLYFHVICLAYIGMFTIAFPESKSIGVQLCLCHLVSYAASWIFRREFVGSIFDKFLALQYIFPKKMAMNIVVGNIDFAESGMLKPTTRRVVSICADWRGYQKLTKSVDEESLELLLKTYYEEIWHSLEHRIENCLYFREWIADELVVTVFSIDDQSYEQVVREALDFSLDLATKVSSKVNENSRHNINICIDIGVSSGYGRVGLVGPHGSQKPTVIGSTPGIAKRLETEAKHQRNRHNFQKPTIVMDGFLAEFFDKFYGPLISCQQVHSNVKDLDGLEVYCWNVDLSERTRLKVSS